MSRQPTEETSLLTTETRATTPNNQGSANDALLLQPQRSTTSNKQWTTTGNKWIKPLLVGFVVIVSVSLTIISSSTSSSKSIVRTNEYVPFPENFVWGAATSSYQIEGATNEDGRGLSIWDTFCDVEGNIVDGSSGTVACNHYHKFKEDVQLMKSLNIKAYRFSIAWPRIFPNGKGTVNRAGIEFYNNLIDELLANDIVPWVTLYHWDLPQALEDEYEGWQSRQIVDDFANYARTCFEEFGDRVKYWITLNESWTVAVQSYNDGTKAPGKVDDPSIKVYQAGHNLILAHAAASKIYKEEFQSTQNGLIGIANCGDYRYPKTPSTEDMIAADRAMIFQFAWLSDPFIYGDYPEEMKERLGDRLPSFTLKERQDMLGSVDFLGLNHYSTLYAANPSEPLSYGGYWGDMDVEFSSDPTWRKNYMGWSVNPDGCRELLLWLSDRYPDIRIVMTENGTSENEPDLATALRDEGRRSYFEGYIRACSEAIDLGTNLIGYFAWSLMDNFEWEYGYTRRFGICYVDYETQTRTPKSSALWYADTIKANGANIIKYLPSSSS